MQETLLLLLFAVALALSHHQHHHHQPLLDLSSRHSCLKDLVGTFVSQEECARLPDSSKAQLALKMSECLLRSMGKDFPVDCQTAGSCRLEGDAWNTFSTFFAHIDNLCHFYWETLHHERAQKLIGSLSQSSQRAEAAMRANTEETRKVLAMQQTMQSTLGESLKQQLEMAALINSSTARIGNLTLQVELFAQKVREDIEGNYASLSLALGVISGGLERVVEFQGYLQAELTSISGMVLFVGEFLFILFLTSFKKYQQVRNPLLSLLALQTALEVLLPSSVLAAIGVKTVRSVFMGVGVLMLLAGAERDQDGLERTISAQLNTPRLERVLRRAVEGQRFERAKRNWLSSREYEQTDWSFGAENAGDEDL